MANVKIVFYGSVESETEEHSLEVFANTKKQIYISIDANNGSEFYNSFIVLDKETAIKFSRELRKQISFI